MSVTSAWIPAKDVTVTVAGIARACTDCSIKRAVGTWDATNLLSGGWDEHGIDIRSAELTGTVVLDSTALQTFTLAALVSSSFATLGGQTHSGTARVTDLTDKGGSRGGMTVAFTLKFTSTVTTA